MMKRNGKRLFTIVWTIITTPVQMILMFIWCILALAWIIGKFGTVKEYWNICKGHDIVDTYQDVWYTIKYGKDKEEA